MLWDFPPHINDERKHGPLWIPTCLGCWGWGIRIIICNKVVIEKQTNLSKNSKSPLFAGQGDTNQQPTDHMQSKVLSFSHTFRSGLRSKSPKVLSLRSTSRQRSMVHLDIQTDYKLCVDHRIWRIVWNLCTVLSFLFFGKYHNWSRSLAKSHWCTQRE